MPDSPSYYNFNAEVQSKIARRQIAINSALSPNHLDMESITIARRLEQEMNTIIIFSYHQDQKAVNTLLKEHMDTTIEKLKKALDRLVQEPINGKSLQISRVLENWLDRDIMIYNMMQ